MSQGNVAAQQDPFPPGFDVRKAQMKKWNASIEAARSRSEAEIKKHEEAIAKQLQADQAMEKERLLEEQKKQEELEAEDQKEVSPYERIEAPAENKDEVQINSEE
jgi:hypothetical protein